jgi:hypothetical protein
LQCEGHLWEAALNAWLTDEKTALVKQREETEKRKAKEDAEMQGKKGRKRKKPRTDRDPALDDDMEDRLRMGLDILIQLAQIIHRSVANSPCLVARAFVNP